jgi:hypothetical protein
MVHQQLVIEMSKFTLKRLLLSTAFIAIGISLLAILFSKSSFACDNFDWIWPLSFALLGASGGLLYKRPVVGLIVGAFIGFGLALALFLSLFFLGPGNLLPLRDGP